MIRLVSSLPEIAAKSAEYTKISCLFDCYKNDPALAFWVQDGGKAVISLADGNMTVFNNKADITELSEFVSVISPSSLFSDYETLRELKLLPDEKISVMYRLSDVSDNPCGDRLSSKEIYDLLNTDGLSLPDYPDFAVDFCRRLNHGCADYFAKSGKCAAVVFYNGDSALLNGIASRESGFGSIALTGALSRTHGRHFFACCREALTGFYEKNGFRRIYYAGYWVKKK